MKLEFAMLADAVLATADNKLIIQGASVDNVRAAAYPAVQPTLALVAMFVQEPSDHASDKHELRIETLDPLGEPWLPPVRGNLVTPVGEDEYPGKSTAVLNFSMLVFPMKGRYTFRLLLDDTPLRDIFFYAIEVPQAATPTTSEQGTTPAPVEG